MATARGFKADVSSISPSSVALTNSITFQEHPYFWDLHIYNLITKQVLAYILRVCKLYSYYQDQLNKLIDSLMLSFFVYSLEVWGFTKSPPQKIINLKICCRQNRQEHLGKGARISTSPDKNWNIQKLVYKQISF